MVAAPISEPVTPVSPLEVVDGVVVNPRPKDVGILAMEMYFPRRVSSSYHCCPTFYS